MADSKVAKQRPTCNVEGCDRQAAPGRKGWCTKHYKRWRRHGDPVFAHHEKSPVRTLEDLLALCREEPCPRPELEGPCMVWTRYTTAGGYGQVTIAYNQILTHRLAYELVHGMLLPCVQVNHRCDVRACCNPAHLKPGTHTENAMDMVRRGRWSS